MLALLAGIIPKDLLISMIEDGIKQFKESGDDSLLRSSAMMYITKHVVDTKYGGDGSKLEATVERNENIVKIFQDKEN